MPRGAAVNVGLLPAEPAAQRHRCVCPCKSLDCVKLSQKKDKRLSVYKTWGWTRRQIAEFEGRLLDGHAKLHNFYVAIEHFAPGDRIVRSGSGERLQQVRGVGVASRGFVPGQPGEPGRFTPSAVPAVTPRTGDRDMSDVAATALEELDRSATVASPADTAAATAAALSVRRELETAHAANAQLQRRFDALSESPPAARRSSAATRRVARCECVSPLGGNRRGPSKTTTGVTPCSTRRSMRFAKVVVTSS
jgi:hypothetical protein